MKIEIEIDEMKVEDSLGSFILNTDSAAEIIAALIDRLHAARLESQSYEQRWREVGAAYKAERERRQAAEDDAAAIMRELTEVRATLADLTVIAGELECSLEREYEANERSEP